MPKHIEIANLLLTLDLVREEMFAWSRQPQLADAV